MKQKNIIVVTKTADVLDPSTIKTAIKALLFQRHLYNSGHAAFMNPHNHGPLDFAIRAHDHWTVITAAITKLAEQLPEERT